MHTHTCTWARAYACSLLPCSLKPYAMAVVDTPPFQRLRGLSQLGVTHFVFPGATHTRFEHSLGTAYKVGGCAQEA